MSTEDDELRRLKASHTAIEDALQAHLNELEIEGLLTGWVLVASLTHLGGDEDYDALYSSQSDGLSKWSHIGMLMSSLETIKDYGLQP